MLPWVGREPSRECFNVASPRRVQAGLASRGVEPAGFPAELLAMRRRRNPLPQERGLIQLADARYGCVNSWLCEKCGVDTPPNHRVRFGSRGATVPTCAIRGADVRRGVAALNSLSRENRADPAARAACLFYALRGDTGSLPLQILLRLVDQRIAAFEWMVANRSQPLVQGIPTAAFEAAVYDAIATEPMIAVGGCQRFDSARFVSRVERSLPRRGNAGETFAQEMAALG
jgi:hypothetical protein